MNEPYLINRSAWQAKVWWPPPYPPPAPVAPAGPTLIDSCPVEKQNDISTYGLGQNGVVAIYQAITCPYHLQLERITASLKNTGGADVNLTTFTYATEGVFPNVKCVPGTGRRSRNLVLPANAEGLFDFTFILPINLAGGQNYGICVEQLSTMPAPVFVGFHMGGDGHYGNGGYYDGFWRDDPNADMIFYIYGTANG